MPSKSVITTILGAALLGMVSKGSLGSKSQWYTPRSLKTLTNLSKSKSKRESVYSLNLRRYEDSKNPIELLEIPEIICKFTEIEELDLSHQRFGTDSFRGIPECFKGLTKLKRIILNDCSLDKIPEVLKFITSLEYIELYDNNITSIPNWISDMPNLRYLQLQKNKIERFTSEQVNIISLQNPDKLMGYGVNLYDNPIKDLPSDFGLVLGKESKNISLNLDFTGSYQNPYGYVASPKNDFSSKKALQLLETGVPRDYLKTICLNSGIIKKHIFNEWKFLRNHTNSFIKNHQVTPEDQQLMNILLDRVEIDFNSTTNLNLIEIQERLFNPLSKLINLESITVIIEGGEIRIPSFLSDFKKLNSVHISGTHYGGPKVIGLHHIKQIRSLKLEMIKGVNASEFSEFKNLSYLFLDQIANMSELPNSVCINNSETLGHLTMSGRWWRTFPKSFGMLKNLSRLNLTLSSYTNWRTPLENGVHMIAPDKVTIVSWLSKGFPQKIAVQIMKQCNKAPISQLRRF